MKFGLYYMSLQNEFWKIFHNLFKITLNFVHGNSTKRSKQLQRVSKCNTTIINFGNLDCSIILLKIKQIIQFYVNLKTHFQIIDKRK